ncbi:hypothetical protein J2Z21_008837 [Streptomyces griseochromogenes]|uniref:Uncharacterized protein n=1 Tax=Streptomyces griseochromogenes TaxID=68214 RepID=A0ABS4M814_9ACTN|nr:hypothetical protein [Streptomyces griseochromogenes]
MEFLFENDAFSFEALRTAGYAVYGAAPTSARCWSRHAR